MMNSFTSTNTAVEISPPSADSSTPLLEVRNLKKYFPIKRGFFQRHVGDVKAVDDVSFTVHPRETLGLVGESGCGKTTVGRCIVRAYQPTSGQLLYHENRAGDVIDLAQIKEGDLGPYRREI